MSEHGDVPVSTDLEYDLAHEAHEAVEQPARHEPHHEPVQVSTETPAYDEGDYGYDLAHEVPGR